MKNEFPYPDCEDCFALVDNECKGVRHWMMCEYLVNEKLKGPISAFLKKKEEHEKMKKENEYYQFLLGLVRSGEIKPDPTLLFATIGDIIFFMRADLIPMSEQTITDEWEIEDGLWEELENGNWRRKKCRK